jgi:hypothetical protein
MPVFVFTRNSGGLAYLEVGEWCSDPTRHRVGSMLVAWCRCPDCGATIEIDTNTVRAGGVVDGHVICPTQTCSFDQESRLEGWGVPVFDTSDTKASPS